MAHSLSIILRYMTRRGRAVKGTKSELTAFMSGLVLVMSSASIEYGSCWSSLLPYAAILYGATCTLRKGERHHSKAVK